MSINLPLGSIPEELSSYPINLTENSHTVFTKRYSRKDEYGNPSETVNETFWRVASNVATNLQDAYQYFYLMADLLFLPNTPTFTGAGTPLGNLSACFVLPIADDLGKQSDGIFATLRDAALIQQAGGGNGFSFSRIRGKGTRVKSSNGEATGSIGFLRAYDSSFDIINQGGIRRCANMGVLNVHHPDILEFIGSKSVEGQIPNFNISVAITDTFMQAVEKDDYYDIIEPSTGKIIEQYKAREVFDLIAKYAHKNGEPGILFIDEANRSNPIPHIGTYEATNPCVTGDTLVLTTSGLCRIDSMLDNKHQEIYIDNRFGIQTSVTSDIFYSGEKEVFLITTKEGYELKATAEHLVMTERGWVAVKDLKINDEIHIAQVNDEFEYNQDEVELGRLLGWVYGDGYVTDESTYLSFYDEKRSLAQNMLDTANKITGHSTTLMDLRNGKEYRFGNKSITKALSQFGKYWNKEQLTDELLTSSVSIQKGFIEALFAADGTVNGNLKIGLTLRLTSINLGMLKNLQNILTRFGMFSVIYENRRKAGFRMLPDGKGGMKEYPTQAYHELCISNESLEKFSSEFDLLLESKKEKLSKFISSRVTKVRKSKFYAKVKSISSVGVQAVYDITEPISHTFISNSIVVHNCGEQWLLPYESCNLGSINLAKHVINNTVDWDKLKSTIQLATRFLDDVVDANKYVPAVPQLREAALASRRIGLGFMGLADMMLMCDIRYGSEVGQEFAASIAEYVRYYAMHTSVQLAKDKSPFPNIIGSIYDYNDLKFTAPTSITSNKFGYKQDLNWNELITEIKLFGIRNAAQTTIAPTGTISTVAGCEGYGCEPIFALAYTRYVLDGENRIKLSYGSPLLEQKLKQNNFSEEEITRIVNKISETGTARDVIEIGELGYSLVVSSDVTVDEHVKMQAAIQAFIDNSISKTINMPEGSTIEDVQKAYKLAWELKCKGLTVYVTGSRDKVVLETNKTKQNKVEVNNKPLKQTRPQELTGKTYKVQSPVGTVYLTLNELENTPFETFINTGKAGSEISAISEGIGRLISLILRQDGDISQNQKLEQIANQLENIGGTRQAGFGKNKVASLPDAISKALKQYLKHDVIVNTVKTISGDICPECGSPTLNKIEGCISCSSCGYAEC